MRPYFCIYEGKYDQWVYNDGKLINHLDIDSLSIPSDYTLNSVVLTNTLQLELRPGNYNWMISEIGHYVESEKIMKFETIQEAEDYLLVKGTLPTDNGEFYSIRRIYC